MTAAAPTRDGAGPPRVSPVHLAALVVWLRPTGAGAFLPRPPAIGGVAERFGRQAGLAMVLPGLVVGLLSTAALAPARAASPSPSQPDRVP